MEDLFDFTQLLDLSIAIRLFRLAREEEGSVYGKMGFLTECIYRKTRYLCKTRPLTAEHTFIF